jgi:Electron transfer flavoprotein, beta subunit
MKILVLVKQIPEISKITFDKNTGRINREGVPLIMNSFDKRAVEEAIRIKERDGSSVMVASMGPPQAADVLDESLRMGADKAFLVSDRKFGGSDTWATSSILSSLIKKLGPDLVLAGKYSLDGETSQVPPQIAQMTGFNFVSAASKMSL